MDPAVPCPAGAPELGLPPPACDRYRIFAIRCPFALCNHGTDADLASDPAYSAVAGMRDLMGELHSNATDAAQTAGDDG